MRTLRGALVGIITLTAAVVLPSAPAAAAPPTAPYTAMVLNSPGKTIAPYQDTATWDQNSSMAFTSSDGSASSIRLTVAVPGYPASVWIRAADSQPFVVGQTYQAGPGAVWYTGQYRNCSSASGTFVVRELTLDGGVPTAFAASFSVNCGAADDTLAGEIRYNSSLGYSGSTNALHFDSFETTRLGDTSELRNYYQTSTGTEPTTYGAASLTGVSASSYLIHNDGCVGLTLNYGQQCAVSVRFRPQAVGGTSAKLSIPDSTSTGTKFVSLSGEGLPSIRGTYTPLQPSRILDTRAGWPGIVGPNGTITFTVAGSGGIPAHDDILAVVLNVTVVNPSAEGYLTVYPFGSAQPNASSLNFPRQWTGANSVTVGVGVLGQISIFNGSAGYSHVLVDAVGYFIGDPSDRYVPMGGRLQTVVPERLLDTRTDWNEMLPADHYAKIVVDYGAAANPHIRALAVNITALNPTRSGYLTAFPGGTNYLPDTSTVNYNGRDLVPNFAIVPVGPCSNCGGATGLPSISVYTTADTHLLVDVMAIFDDGQLADGLRFEPRNPTRILDTRTGLGGVGSALGPNQTVTITAPGEVLGGETDALAFNVTAVAPSQLTYLSLWPAGYPSIPQPEVSTLNPAPGRATPNAAITLIGPENKFNIFNAAGYCNVLVDVVGRYYWYPGDPSSSAAGARTADGTSKSGLKLQATNSTMQAR